LAKPTTRNEDPPAEHTSRDKIKAIASDLVTMRGYHAITFREIAEAIKTTRANLHYHFGSKDKLIEEVLADYVTVTVDFYRTTFTAPQISLREKMRRVREFLKARYQRFNPEGLTSHPWSLSARLRSDWEALSPQMKETMREFSSENDISVRIGIGLAINSGELREDTPQEDVALLLLNNILYAANVTRDTQSFDRLTALWEATLDAIQGAYGAQEGEGSNKRPITNRESSATQKGPREKHAKR
jgi:TetR/AcrR family transcriptional repressor of nem operon